MVVHTPAPVILCAPSPLYRMLSRKPPATFSIVHSNSSLESGKQSLSSMRHMDHNHTLRLSTVVTRRLHSSTSLRTGDRGCQPPRSTCIVDTGKVTTSAE